MPDAPGLTFDEQPITIESGDSILTALTRAGIHPTGGGCLCFGGDCPHCVATVDGISYVRTCQTPAVAGTEVVSHPDDGNPPLRFTPRSNAEIPVTYARTDLVVIGAGSSGVAAAAAAEEAGRAVIVLDAAAGQEVIGIYDGPLVVARTAASMLHVDCSEITPKPAE